MTTIAAFASGRSSNSLCASVPATADSSLTTRVIADEYGRAAISASCARRSFAVETSLIARVILRVFLTLVIRLRIAFRLGMALLLLLHRELLGELGQGVAQPLLQIARALLAGRVLDVLELAGRLELLEDVVLARLQERQELALVAGEHADRVVVDEAVGAGVDHDDLLLHRHRLELALLEQLDHALA